MSKMKTYNDLLLEFNISTNPFARKIGLHAAVGAMRAVEDLAREVVSSGVRFVVRNPQVALGAAIVTDQIVFGGAGTKALARYFEQRFPGHAMSVYRSLSDITVDHNLNPEDTAKMMQDTVTDMQV